MIIASIAFAVAQLGSVTAVRDSYPDISPDGRVLLFQSNRSGKQAIWLADEKGGNLHLLFDGGTLGTNPATPRWSPDGQWIAFAMRPADASDEDESDIYRMRRDGTELQRLTNAWGDDSHPHWSADGKRIFFNSPRATPDRKLEWSRQWIDIYSMAPDGGDVRRHTDCRAVCTYPVPSPDGRFVVHRQVVPSPGINWDTSTSERNSEVFVTALKGSWSINVSNSPAFDGWPIWSPNGRWILFASNRAKSANVGQILAVRPDGTGLHELTDVKLSRVQPSLSADGNRLYLYENLETDNFEIGHVASMPLMLP